MNLQKCKRIQHICQIITQQPTITSLKVVYRIHINIDQPLSTTKNYFIKHAS